MSGNNITQNVFSEIFLLLDTLLNQGKKDQPWDSILLIDVCVLDSIFYVNNFHAERTCICVCVSEWFCRLMDVSECICAFANLCVYMWNHTSTHIHRFTYTNIDIQQQSYTHRITHTHTTHTCHYSLSLSIYIYIQTYIYIYIYWSISVVKLTILLNTCDGCD